MNNRVRNYLIGGAICGLICVVCAFGMTIAAKSPPILGSAHYWAPVVALKWGFIILALLSPLVALTLALEKTRAPLFNVISVLMLFACGASGVFAAVCQDRPPMGALHTALLAPCIGTLCALISIWRREDSTSLTLFGLIPNAFLLGYSVFMMLCVYCYSIHH